MASFLWAPCFVTGLPRVDEQHHHLVNLINRLGDLVLGADGVGLQQIEPIYEELASYAQQHFHEEEVLMAQRGVDLRHCRMHHEEHHRFLQESQRMQATLAGADATHIALESRRLLQFLSDWLAYHILGCDQVLAAQLAAIDGGRPPREAYAAAQRAHDPATATLLQALDGLFRQVSERNRELFELNQTLESRVDERTQALCAANRRLEEMALTDVLTGLANRRQAMRRLNLEWEEATRSGRPMSCIMLDADGFKAVNDRWGHDAGDAVLQRLALALKEAVRTDDTVCRLGGDEFLVICAATPLEGAVQIAEKLRSTVAALRVPVGAGQWLGSLSVGVAARSAQMAQVEDLLKAADAGLYQAKHQGRNVVATALAA